MEWVSEGIILSSRAHGENGAIVNLLTPDHGRHAGMLAGGQGSRAQPIVQPGNRVKASWRARTLDQLGYYQLDLLTSHASAWMDDIQILSIIASAMAVTEIAVPERQAMPGVYAGLATMLSLPHADLWGPVYVQWEIGLLKSLGYGLDLGSCALSGGADDLTHVSPRTGRAVSMQAAAPYLEKLLKLPGFLLGISPEGDDMAGEILTGLTLTGHFLDRHVFLAAHHGGGKIPTMPPARQRLLEYYRKQVDGARAVA